MKLVDYFGSFLRDRVNLNDARLAQLDARVTAIVNVLKADAVIGPLFLEHIRQGSWAHRTIIRPLPGNEFDADILLRLTPVPEWATDPKRYITAVSAAFGRSSVYASMAERKNRCVRIHYANDCHVDVVPYLALADDRQVIVNFAANVFEDTDPVGFTAWMQTHDVAAAGHLRRVIRLMKFLRDFKGTFSVPSIILTTFLGNRVIVGSEDTHYTDLPTALVNLVEALDSWLSWHPTMPVIEDPSGTGTTFNHRWDEERYQTFRVRLAFYSTKMRAAYDEPEKAKSVTMWQEVFGTDFKQPPPTAAAALPPPSTVTTTHQAAPGEEFIASRFPVRWTNDATIRCVVQPDASSNGFPVRPGRALPKQRRLHFTVGTDVEPPFTVYWKVRNFGAEAEADHGLRGTLMADDGSLSRDENTRYAGTHYMDCFVVKDGRVVATARFEVRIR